MKTLTQHNEKKLRDHAKTLEPHLNGIACPKCSAELMDTHPYLALATMPAQYNVHCPKCTYSGYRY